MARILYLENKGARIEDAVYNLIDKELNVKTYCDAPPRRELARRRVERTTETQRMIPRRWSL